MPLEIADEQIVDAHEDAPSRARRRALGAMKMPSRTIVGRVLKFPERDHRARQAGRHPPLGKRGDVGPPCRTSRDRLELHDGIGGVARFSQSNASRSSRRDDQRPGKGRARLRLVTSCALKTSIATVGIAGTDRDEDRDDQRQSPGDGSRQAAVSAAAPMIENAISSWCPDRHPTQTPSISGTSTRK